MATLHHIISGPSRWDIMMSIFESKPVSFTLSDEPRRKKFSLNDDGIAEVVIKTLHDHATEDYILMDPMPTEGYKPSFNLKRNEPTWLMIAEHASVIANSLSSDAPFDTALIEYNERTRFGFAVTYSEEEVFVENLVDIADYWRMKMETVIATS